MWEGFHTEGSPPPSLIEGVSMYVVHMEAIPIPTKILKPHAFLGSLFPLVQLEVGVCGKAFLQKSPPPEV